jgi:hypothetical protein
VLRGVNCPETHKNGFKKKKKKALLNAVVTSQPPAEKTIIERFVPPVPNMDNFFVEGIKFMTPLENRYICFQCFEALKALF